MGATDDRLPHDRIRPVGNDVDLAGGPIVGLDLRQHGGVIIHTQVGSLRNSSGTASQAALTSTAEILPAVVTETVFEIPELTLNSPTGWCPVPAMIAFCTESPKPRMNDGVNTASRPAPPSSCHSSSDTGM